MNIVIVEQLRKANEESKIILKNNMETSLKRREQQDTYFKDKLSNVNNERRESLISRLISTIKTHWYC